MSSSFRDSVHSLDTASEYDPYYDYMEPSQMDNTRSPALNSPPMSDTDTSAHQTQLSFRSSVGLLPTPGTVSKRHPKYEYIGLKFWIVVVGCAELIIVGIALEVALSISNSHNGYKVPQKNLFPFVPTRVLTTFFPGLIVVPLALMVYTFDWGIRMWNPYLILSHGNASPDETLLVDYMADSWLIVMYNALKFKHRFVFLSGLTVPYGLLFLPLGSSIFSIQPVPQSSASTAQSLMAIGLSPDINDLTAFAASAGFAEASVFNGLSDPPFTWGGWATAEFEFPTNNFLNGSMSINTTGIATSVNCAIPNQFTVISSSATSWSVSATSTSGCTVNASFDPNNSYQQYGVQNVPDCGFNTTDPTFQPVFFWFWQQEPSGSAAVFCEPQIALFDVTAFASLNNGSLTSVSVIDNYPATNNISGPPLNGIPYNGLIFNSSTDINVQARATTIRSSIPNAIFRQAQQAPGGLVSAFQSPQLFADYTEAIYSRYLSLATKSNYFLPHNSTRFAVLTQLQSRLFVEPLPAHALAAIFMLTGIFTFFLHLRHFRERRSVYLAHPPGSIASMAALTSHSGFGELLMPFDNVPAFRRVLAQLRFRLDPRTGAIVVDDSAVAYAGKQSTSAARDETMMTLIGNVPRHRREESAGDDTTRGT